MRCLFALILSLGLGPINVCAQIGFTLNYVADTSFTGQSAPQLVLLRFERGGVIPVDTVPLPMTDPFSAEVVLPEGSIPGLYLLSVDRGRPFELILSKGRLPSVSGTISELRDGQGRIGRSIENEAYYQFVDLAARTDARMADLRAEHAGLPDIDPQYFSKLLQMEKELFRLQKRFNRQLDSLGLLYAHTLVADEYLPMARFPSPTEEQRTRCGTNRSFLFDHYFSTTDLSGERLADNHVFQNRIKYYLQTVAPPQDAYQKEAIDNILAHARKFPANYGHVVETLISFYYNGRRDELVLYAHERYTEENCSDEGLRVDDIVAGLKLNQMGAVAGELVLPDTAGNMVSLHSTALANRATLLLFWSSRCSVCMDELPTLSDIYHRHRDSGLAVYAVNLDPDRKDWTNTLQQFDLGWINVNEVMKRNGSQVEEHYRIRQTPTLYVLDKEGRIASKGLFGPELERFLLLMFQDGQ